MYNDRKRLATCIVLLVHIILASCMPTNTSAIDSQTVTAAVNGSQAKNLTVDPPPGLTCTFLSRRGLTVDAFEAQSLMVWLMARYAQFDLSQPLPSTALEFPSFPNVGVDINVAPKADFKVVFFLWALRQTQVWIIDELDDFQTTLTTVTYLGDVVGTISIYERDSLQNSTTQSSPIARRRDVANTTVGDDVSVDVSYISDEHFDEDDDFFLSMSRVVLELAIGAINPIDQLTYNLADYIATYEVQAQPGQLASSTIGVALRTAQQIISFGFANSRLLPMQGIASRGSVHIQSSAINVLAAAAF